MDSDKKISIFVISVLILILAYWIIQFYLLKADLTKNYEFKCQDNQYSACINNQKSFVEYNDYEFPVLVNYNQSYIVCSGGEVAVCKNP